MVLCAHFCSRDTVLAQAKELKAYATATGESKYLRAVMHLTAPLLEDRDRNADPKKRSAGRPQKQTGVDKDMREAYWDARRDLDKRGLSDECSGERQCCCAWPKVNSCPGNVAAY
jgi:hypothetical protein